MAYSFPPSIKENIFPFLLLVWIGEGLKINGTKLRIVGYIEQFH